VYVLHTHPSHFCQSVELDAVSLAVFIIMTRYVALLTTIHHITSHHMQKTETSSSSSSLSSMNFIAMQVLNKTSGLKDLCIREITLKKWLYIFAV